MTVPILPYAWGGPVAQGILRAEPEDFDVTEIAGFEPTGTGEHHWLVIEKRGANTQWVAAQLAKHAGVAPIDVGYAGRKDRHAVTRQAFTVRVPRTRDIDWQTADIEGVRMLEVSRHARKLPRGALAGNRFALRIRDFRGDTGRAAQQLGQIARRGMPNYFGEQRFGNAGGNLPAALAMFAGQRVRRDQRDLLLSAARSTIFNAVLAARVELASWCRGIPGDVWQIDGSGSIFGPEPIGDALRERCDAGSIHPTGPMWGKGETRAEDAARALEQASAGTHPELAAGLLAAGVAMQRRALRVVPRDLQWAFDRDDLTLGFVLPPGSYATCLLRELVDVTGGVDGGHSGTGHGGPEDYS